MVSIWRWSQVTWCWFLHSDTLIFEFLTLILLYAAILSLIWALWIFADSAVVIQLSRPCFLKSSFKISIECIFSTLFWKIWLQSGDDPLPHLPHLTYLPQLPQSGVMTSQVENKRSMRVENQSECSIITSFFAIRSNFQLFLKKIGFNL